MTAATYEYVAENGDPLYTVKRTADKRFSQVPASGKTGPGAMNGVRRVLYRLPALRSAIERGDDEIFVCEGEKAAEALVELGYTATTVAGGSNAAWLDGYTEALRGALLVRVIADRDEPGEKHAEKIRLALDAAGVPVVVEQSATLDKGDDIVEHLAAGYGLRDLVPLEVAASRPSSSWAILDIVEAGGTPPEPPDIFGMFYSGRTHLLSGLPSAGKTMLMAIVMAGEIQAGRSALYLDFDRMGASDILERVAGLGVPEEVLRSSLPYVQPEGVPTEGELGALASACVERSVSLVVVDAFNPALSAYKLNPNAMVEVDDLIARLAVPLAKTGAAVVFLDHVVKDRETRGMFAAGSERKVSGTDVHIQLAAIGDGFSRGSTGRSKILVHRDRRGFLRNGPFGELVIESDDETGAITWRVERKNPANTRPSGMMEQTSRFLEAVGVPQSGNALQRELRGNSRMRREATALLIEEGFARRIEGKQGASLVEHVRLYVQADDPLSDRYQTQTSTTSTNLDPTSTRSNCSETSTTSTNPYRGSRLVESNSRGREDTSTSTNPLDDIRSILEHENGVAS